MAPPMAASTSDSTSVPTKAGKPPKPMARKVAISTARAATEVEIATLRAGEGAERHGDRERPAELLDEVGRLRRLVGEIGGLRLHVELQAWIVVDIALQRREARRIVQPRPHGLEKVRPVEQALHYRQVGPDLGFEHAAAGLEHADDRPAAGAERDRLTEIESLELARQALADDDLVGAAVEHAAGRKIDALAQRRALLADAAQRQVGLGLARTLDPVDYEIEFRRHK